MDTNILIYGIYGNAEQQKALSGVLQNKNGATVISTQVLKEFANVCLKKKLSKNNAELKSHLAEIKKAFEVVEISVDTILAAIDVSYKHKYSFYDSLIIASAIENNCHRLYTEDLQHGQFIGKKLRILNPFK